MQGKVLAQRLVMHLHIWLIYIWLHLHFLNIWHVKKHPDFPAFSQQSHSYKLKIAQTIALEKH